MKKMILIASEAKLFYHIFEAILADDYIAVHAFTINEAIKILRKEKISLILTSDRVENGSCFDLVSKVRKGDSKIRDIPVIILSENITSAAIMSSNKLAVDEVEKLPIEPLEFSEKVELVIQKHAKPYQKPDPVTGLPRKQLGEEEISDMLKSGKKGALILIDLDHYSFAGSGVSKNALIITRDILKSMLHGEAVLSVLAAGGFMIFIPEMRDRKSIEDYASSLIRGIKASINDEKIYISIGLAVTDRHGSNYNDLYKMCDLGLSRSRTSGKNRANFFRW